MRDTARILRTAFIYTFTLSGYFENLVLYFFNFDISYNYNFYNLYKFFFIQDIISLYSTREPRMQYQLLFILLFVNQL